MTNRDIFEQVSVLQIVAVMTVVVVMLLRRAYERFPALLCYLVNTAIGGAATAWFFFGIKIHPTQFEIQVYLASFWAVQVISLVLDVLIIYGIFFEAMRPFPGLQRLGQIVFRWIGVVSLAVAIALAAGPDLFSHKVPAGTLILDTFGRLEQGISVLILCLMIFVCFAIRPLGLTFRSHIFGIVLGLGLLSMIQLVQAAWIATTVGTLYSPVYTLGMVGTIVAIGIWGVYFALPDPKRRMILLPTTSPFFLWNRISEVLGDAPGNVAVAGFTPDMLAPGEIQMLTMATSREAAAERERESLAWDEPQAAAILSDFPKPGRAAFALSR